MDSDMVPKRGKLMIVGHSFVRRMSVICSSNAEYRYFCPDLLLSVMFNKVVFRGSGVYVLLIVLIKVNVYIINVSILAWL